MTVVREATLLDVFELFPIDMTSPSMVMFYLMTVLILSFLLWHGINQAEGEEESGHNSEQDAEHTVTPYVITSLLVISMIAFIGLTIQERTEQSNNLYLESVENIDHLDTTDHAIIRELGDGMYWIRDIRESSK